MIPALELPDSCEQWENTTGEVLSAAACCESLSAEQAGGSHHMGNSTREHKLVASSTPSWQQLSTCVSCSSTHTHTALLEEGQAIERVGFIKEGRCLAYAKVPNTPRPVQVSTQQCHIQWCGKGGNKIIFLISVGVRWWAWPGQLYWRATLEGKRNSAIFYCLCSPSEGWMGWWYSHKRQVLEDTEM